jgi:DNA polymerase III epsilon subunit-like protein
MILVFDTEATGLPRNFYASIQDTTNWPRVVQLAWQTFDTQGTLLSTHNYIIKPEGFTIPARAAEIHGITTDRALLEGKPLLTVLNELNEALRTATLLVAHNVRFDLYVLGAEMARASLPTRLFDMPNLCTQMSSTHYCRLPGKYGFKWPTLNELHLKLFGEPVANAHDALGDVQATARAFFKLREIGVI